MVISPTLRASLAHSYVLWEGALAPRDEELEKALEAASGGHPVKRSALFVVIVVLLRRRPVIESRVCKHLEPFQPETSFPLP
jgi:hypothetical protein